MRIMLERGKCAPQDVTEAVQILYDALHASVDFGSGFLDTAEVDAMRLLADAAGWEPVEYDLDVCQTCGHLRNQHRNPTSRLSKETSCMVGPSSWVSADLPTRIVKCECPAFVAEWQRVKQT